MKLALVWEDENGAPRSYTLNPKKEYYIGRLSRQDQKVLGIEDSDQVYIWSTDYTEHVPTGISTRYAPREAGYRGLRLIVISRRHAKLYYRNGSWHIKDHGPTGEGSMNGTFVNSTRLPRGAERPIGPGDKIKLSPVSKVIIVGEAEKQTVRITLRAAEELPSTLARDLSEKGLVEEISEAPGGNSITVLRRQSEPRSVELSSGIRIEIEAAGSETYKAERVRAKVNEIVIRLYGFIMNIDYYRRGNINESLMQDESTSLYGYLASRSVKELIRGLGDEEAVRLLDEVAEMLRIMGNDINMVDIATFKRKIIMLKSLLESYL